MASTVCKTSSTRRRAIEDTERLLSAMCGRKEGHRVFHKTDIHLTLGRQTVFTHLLLASAQTPTSVPTAPAAPVAAREDVGHVRIGQRARRRIRRVQNHLLQTPESGQRSTKLCKSSMRAREGLRQGWCGAECRVRGAGGRRCLLGTGSSRRESRRSRSSTGVRRFAEATLSTEPIVDEDGEESKVSSVGFAHRLSCRRNDR